MCKPTPWRYSTILLIWLMLAAVPVGAESPEKVEPLEIGTQLQLFVDRYVIESLDQVELRLQQPVKMPLAKSPFAGQYATVIKDGGMYRAYWRDSVQIRPEGERATELYRYAESRDGHEWVHPKLGLFELHGSTDNNVLFGSHTFSPFLDTQPGVAPTERYKALARTGYGLQAFVSPDGIHWTGTYERVLALKGGPPQTGLVIEKDPADTNAWDVWFDSQNVSFWSEAEQRYVCYFRTRARQEGQNKPVRTISRTTSTNFFSGWSRPVRMEANLPGEQLYTSQTHPYFRAPQIYVALPTRLQPGYRGNSTDILFMATRPGAIRYERLFTEAFIRPGLDPERWGNRANYAALNVVPTGPAEMSIYHLSGHRYVLRTDGFVSVHAGSQEGSLLTKVLTFSGRELLINYSTSAGGNVHVEIQDDAGRPIPGFRLADCPRIVGDHIERAVQWQKAPDLQGLAGRPVRLRFVLVEADLYSFRFAEKAP